MQLLNCFVEGCFELLNSASLLFLQVLHILLVSSLLVMEFSVVHGRLAIKHVLVRRLNRSNREVVALFLVQLEGPVVCDDLV